MISIVARSEGGEVSTGALGFSTKNRSFLGEGSDSLVYSSNNHELDVIKKIKPPYFLTEIFYENQLKKAINEFEIGQLIGNHRNFVYYKNLLIKHYPISKEIKLKMKIEFASGKKLPSCRGLIDEKDCFEFLRQGHAALSHLNSLKVAWDDICADNFLIDMNNKIVRFIDYGEYSVLQDENSRVYKLISGFAAFNYAIGCNFKQTERFRKMEEVITQILVQASNEEENTSVSSTYLLKNLIDEIELHIPQPS